jgi:hypothetical protein
MHICDKIKKAVSLFSSVFGVMMMMEICYSVTLAFRQTTGNKVDGGQ